MSVRPCWLWGLGLIGVAIVALLAVIAYALLSDENGAPQAQVAQLPETPTLTPTPPVTSTLAPSSPSSTSTPVSSTETPEESATQVYRYRPPAPADLLPPSEENSCWAGSIASGRYDAFRCRTGNFIHDPCFTYGLDTVVCPVDPRTDADDIVFTFDTATLPYAGLGEATVWFMVVKGEGCHAITGTAPLVAGKSFPFGCKTVYCTPPVEEPDGFVSDCWHPDSGRENTYPVDALWY